MAFEMKYDRDGNPIKQQAPSFDEPVVVEQTSSLDSLVETQTSEPESLDIPDVHSDLSAQPVQNNHVKQPSESWKQLREKALAAERRSQELEAALIQAQSQRQPAQTSPEETEEEVSIDADALVEGKHLSKVNKQIRSLQDQLKQYQQQNTLSSTELKLKSQYNDFDSVVTRDNLESLRLAYPEIAQSLNSNPDLYAKAVSAYTMIKKLGIGVEDSFIEEKAAIQRNAAKPKPLASINPQQGDSPLSKANAFATSGKLTDELKAQMLKEMNEFRNR